MLLKIRDMAKSNMNDKVCEHISTNEQNQQEQMKEIITTYNQSFIRGKTNFDVTKTSSTNRNMQKSR